MSTPLTAFGVTSSDRFSICLYGSPSCGFTYLVGVEGSGLLATSGPASDYGLGLDGVSLSERTHAVLTRNGAIDAAMGFIPEGAMVRVHAPGTGSIIRKGVNRSGRILPV